MKTSMILITPQIAENYLRKNTMNRPPSPAAINEYARQMSAGLWYEGTGEAIKISPSGIIVDGQQRLMAIVKSGVSLNFLVVEVSEEAFKYIDSGKKRTARDIFATAGILNYTNIAAGLRRYVTLKRGRSLGNDISRGINNAMLKTSNAELYSIYCANTELFQGAHSNSSKWYIKSGRLMQLSEILAYYIFFREIDKDDAFTFMEMLFNAHNVPSDSPISLLRIRLYEDKVNTRHKIPGQIKTMLIIKTWNFFRKNETPKRLIIDISKESMPVAI